MHILCIAYYKEARGEVTFRSLYIIQNFHEFNCRGKSNVRNKRIAPCGRELQTIIMGTT